jgi:fused signal recognition particle receptor
MTDTNHDGASPQYLVNTTLLIPPLAPKIAAMGVRNPHWGQISRYEFWRRKLFGEPAIKKAGEPEVNVGQNVQPAVRPEVDVEPLAVPTAPVEASVTEAEHAELPTPSGSAVVTEESVAAATESMAAAEGATPDIVPQVTEAPPVEPEPEAGEEPKESGFARIKRALSRTGQGFERVFLGQKQIDDELLEDLETQLLTADLGMEVTTEVIDALTERVNRKELKEVDRLQAVLKELLVDILTPCEQALAISDDKPFVILTVGVNGVGKTTTIGKLARQNLNEGRSVMLAAGDTFRAAAVEQLQTWGERNDVPVIAQHTGADSASVIFDALESARARKQDVLIADTAGRLHNKDNLMEELRKIKRVMAKLDDSAPHEVLLVLDAGTGQNAVNQLEQFHAAVGVTGIIVTKLDGTAKGGVIFALCRKFGIPIRYIGVGEGLDDLQPFSASDFVDALLDSGSGSPSATVH